MLYPTRPIHAILLIIGLPFCLILILVYIILLPFMWIISLCGYKFSISIGSDD